MADLYPTPHRLALLRDIRDGRVRDDGQLTPMLHFEEDGEAKSAKVAGAVWLMGRAGWCELPPGTDEPAELSTWRLTDAGRAVLLAYDAEAVIDPGEGLLT